MRQLILLILLSCGCCHATDQAIRFELRQGYLIVTQCTVGDLPLKAIIDTGANQTVLDSRVAHRLSLRSSTDSATFIVREVQVRSVLAPSVSLGPLQSGPMNVISADLSAFAAQAETPIDVIIGMDLLGRSDFLIDYGARQLRFGPVPALKHRSQLELRQGLATVSLAGLGSSLRVVVDTGFPQLLLFHGRLGRELRTREAPLKLATLSYTERLKEFDSPPIQIGDWQITHPRLLVADDEQEQAEFDGLFGPKFLAARRIGFDFIHQILSWE